MNEDEDASHIRAVVVAPFTWARCVEQPGRLLRHRKPPDLKRARRWYRRAALKEHHIGLFEYGLMLLEGEGGPKRPANGRRYLERAAALGYIPALDVLSYAFSEGGYGYRRSPSRAKRFKEATRRARLRNR
jgi:TPR repeat protein